MKHFTLVEVALASMALLPPMVAGVCLADATPEIYEEIYVNGSNVLPSAV